MSEKERELTFNLPDELVSGLAEIAMVDDTSPGLNFDPNKYSPEDVAQFVAEKYTSEAVNEYIQNRRDAPEFPAQLAEARARVNRQMDQQIFGDNPNLN
jgi:hypothetical protein